MIEIQCNHFPEHAGVLGQLTLLFITALLSELTLSPVPPVLGLAPVVVSPSSSLALRLSATESRSSSRPGSSWSRSGSVSPVASPRDSSAVVLLVLPLLERDDERVIQLFCVKDVRT